MVVPALVGWSLGIADGIATRRFGPVAQIASRGLAAERRRVAATCAAVTIGLAGTIAIATWLTSLGRSLHAVFATVFTNVDLVVSVGADPFSPDATRVDGSVVEALASLPGVSHADPLRVATVGFDGALVAVIATEARAYREGRRVLPMIDGDPAVAARALAARSGVVVNQAFVRRLGRRIGDVIELATPNGVIRPRIVGVHLEITPGDLPVVRMDLGLYRARWRDLTASLVEVALAPGANPRRVAEAIRSRFGADHGLVVFTLEQVRREYEAMLDHLSRLVHPLLVVAVATTLVGIVCARVTSMLARVRLGGMLRAIGTTRGQLGRIVTAEAALVGGVTTVLAALAGGLLGVLQVDVLMRGMLGMSVAYAYPCSTAMWGGMAVIALTSAAGWALGRQATRLPVAEALRWE
jgi:putative ABC transport system permease protein